MAPTLVLALTAAAVAGHPGYGQRPAMATLDIDNHFAGDASVFVDGRFEGTVGGFDELLVRVRPGHHDVTVRRQETGFVLASTHLHVTPGRPASLDVFAPRASLTLRNQGAVPVRLGAEGHGAWLPPGGAINLDVTAGPVPVTAMVADPRGDWLVFDRTVWAEPGRGNLEVLRPDPAEVQLTNLQEMPMRVLVDGVPTDVVIRPGGSRTLFLRPGVARITWTDLRGRVRMTEQLSLRRGLSTAVVLHDVGRRPVARAPVHDPRRPSGPPRRR